MIPNPPQLIPKTFVSHLFRGYRLKHILRKHKSFYSGNGVSKTQEFLMKMPQGSAENSGESKNEHEKYLEEGSFILRFPYYKNVRYVNLLGSSTVEVSSGRSSTPPKKTEKVILQMDLFNHLNN